MLARTIAVRPTFSCHRAVIRTLYTANTTNLRSPTSPFSTGTPTSSTAPNNSSSDASTTNTRRRWARHVIGNSLTQELEKQKDLPPTPKKEVSAPTSDSTTKSTKRKRRSLKPLKSPITLTSTAMDHLRALSKGPEPKLIRISVRNRGCSGLSYQLEYVEKPEKFDEIVVQDDVKVVIDSKALFSVIGSEMDWVDTKLSSKFVFKNPNSKGTCGCGESFMV